MGKCTTEKYTTGKGTMREAQVSCISLSAVFSLHGIRFGWRNVRWGKVRWENTSDGEMHDGEIHDGKGHDERSAGIVYFSIRGFLPSRNPLRMEKCTMGKGAMGEHLGWGNARWGKVR